MDLNARDVILDNFFNPKVLIFLVISTKTCCWYSLEVPQPHASNKYPQHVFIENICCGYTLDGPRQGTSNEYPHFMFSRRKRKLFT